MGVNSLPKTVTRQRRNCDLNLGPSAPESSTLTTRLPSHERFGCINIIPSIFGTSAIVDPTQPIDNSAAAVWGGGGHSRAAVRLAAVAVAATALAARRGAGRTDAASPRQVGANIR